LERKALQSKKADCSKSSGSTIENAHAAAAANIFEIGLATPVSLARLSSRQDAPPPDHLHAVRTYPLQHACSVTGGLKPVRTPCNSTHDGRSARCSSLSFLAEREYPLRLVDGILGTGVRVAQESFRGARMRVDARKPSPVDAPP
jgi:hypothetical protein